MYNIFSSLPPEAAAGLLGTLKFILCFFAGSYAADLLKKYDASKNFTNVTKTFGKWSVMNLLLPILLYSAFFLETTEGSEAAPQLSPTLAFTAIGLGILIWFITYTTSHGLNICVQNTCKPSDNRHFRISFSFLRSVVYGRKSAAGYTSEEKGKKLPERALSDGLKTKYLPFITSSFGGGNRGVLLILLIFLALPDTKNTLLLPTFILLDMGYFLTLLLVGQIIIRWVYHKDDNGMDIIDFFTFFWDKIKDILPIIFALLYGEMLADNPPFPETTAIVKTITGYILAFLTPLLVKLSAADDTKLNKKQTRTDILWFYAARFVSLGLFVGCLLALQNAQITVIQQNFHAFLIIGVIFALLPPSSLINPMLESNNIPQSESAPANRLIWILSRLYVHIYILLALAICAGYLYQAW